MADSMEPCKMLWADPCCHGNEIWSRRGDPVAYRLVRIECVPVRNNPQKHAVQSYMHTAGDDDYVEFSVQTLISCEIYFSNILTSFMCKQETGA